MTTVGMPCSRILTSMRWAMRNERYVGRGWSKMSPSQTRTSGCCASARSTAASKETSKSCSRWLTPSVVYGRYDRPRWASPRAATFISVHQRRHVGRRRVHAGGRRVARARHVVVQVHLGRDCEWRLQVGDQALAGHQRLDLGTEGADVLLGRRAQDVAVLLIGQAEDEEGVELAEELVVEELGLLRDRTQADLELAAFASDTREDVRLAVTVAGEHALGLLQSDGDDRQALVDLGLLEVGRRPLVEDLAGEERRHQHLFGGAKTADVDEHDLALLEVAH